MGELVTFVKGMELRDAILGPLYFLVILAIGNRMRKRYKELPEGKYFMPALLLKLGGAVLLGFIYSLYYSWGDTFSYFAGGQAWANTFWADPGAAMDFLVDPYDATHVQWVKAYSDYPQAGYIFKGTSELFMVRLTGIFALLGASAYIPTALLFAFISFTGMWAMYRTFLIIHPNMEKGYAWACFFIPSVFFWGSGILKDTITLGCIGWITYTVFRIFLKGHFGVRNLVFLAISVYFIMNLKGYILLAFLPALAVWVFLTYRSRIASPFLRQLSTPLFLGLGILAGVLLIGQIGESLGRYSLENLESTATATQSWHQVARQEGANYSLGATDFSPSGLISSMPAAVNVTLFRPYLWEATGGVAYISALESLAILLFTIYILITGVFRRATLVFKDPFIFFCLVFTIIFATAVGLTSNNFGALARYKIPCIPFFVAMLFTLYYQVQEIKKKKHGRALASA